VENEITYTYNSGYALLNITNNSDKIMSRRCQLSNLALWIVSANASRCFIGYYAKKKIASFVVPTVGKHLVIFIENNGHSLSRDSDITKRDPTKKQKSLHDFREGFL